MPDLLDLLPKRYRSAAVRLMRRRLARYDRGLPMDLTEPVTADQAASAPLPVETVARGVRPTAATAAAALLVVLAGVTAALGIQGLGRPLFGLVGEPAVDGMTKLVQLVFAGFFGAVLLIVLVIAALHAYAAWRIWQGVNWGWVEGLAIALIGGPFAVLSLGLVDSSGWQANPPVLVAGAAYLAAIGLILASRAWLGPVRFPMNAQRAPWWLRLLSRWR